MIKQLVKFRILSGFNLTAEEAKLLEHPITKFAEWIIDYDSQALEKRRKTIVGRFHRIFACIFIEINKLRGGKAVPLYRFTKNLSFYFQDASILMTKLWVASSKRTIREKYSELIKKADERMPRRCDKRMENK